MKSFLGILIAAQLLAIPGASAQVITPADAQFVIEGKGEVTEPTRVEEFKWYYRTYNGVCQMRLWSVTYGYWVTDWINCSDLE